MNKIDNLNRIKGEKKADLIKKCKKALFTFPVEHPESDKIEIQIQELKELHE